jgi:hypothetical protein
MERDTVYLLAEWLKLALQLLLLLLLILSLLKGEALLGARHKLLAIILLNE